MPTVNISDEGKRRIERIKDHSKWDPSNREVVDKALVILEGNEVPEGERVDNKTEAN